MKTVNESGLGPSKAVVDRLLQLVGFQEGSEKGKLSFGKEYSWMTKAWEPERKNFCQSLPI